MNPNASKFIDKLYALVDRQIIKLNDKAYWYKTEKYPPEICGLKYMKYTDPLEEQIEDLRKWKKASQHAEYMLGEIETLKAENSRLKIALLSAANTVAEYGEYGKAELIRRQAQ